MREDLSLPPKIRASLNLRMKYSPEEGCTYDLSTELIVTSSIDPRSSEKGLIMTGWPIVDSTLRLDPVYIVSSYESNSHVSKVTTGVLVLILLIFS